ncbi:MAG: hypothetical protein BGO55_06650 [Sphingobacteriales bacterium 50-39]|nr:hypothetical protein [Sphingobacteriales bacterium]OJW52934.1 MAG: hypothetical protein BGO55_06650 [Sphingobacteriales bacterium 50-39]
MKNIGKWTSSIVIVLLLVLAIDLNSNWRKWPSHGGLPLFAANIILGGLLILFILFSTIKNRR